MYEENQAQEINQQSSLPWGMIAVVAFLVLVSLGGLFYFFTTSFVTTPIP